MFLLLPCLLCSPAFTSEPTNTFVRLISLQRSALTPSFLAHPSAQVIKARIHGLIEREYLERDPNQANHYSYLA